MVRFYAIVCGSNTRRYVVKSIILATCCECFEYGCNTSTHDAITCDCVWFEHQVLCCEIDHVANRANGRDTGVVGAMDVRGMAARVDPGIVRRYHMVV